MSKAMTITLCSRPGSYPRWAAHRWASPSSRPRPSSRPSTRSSRTRRAAAATTCSRPSITPQIVAACSVTRRFMSSSPPFSGRSRVIRWAGTSSPTRIGATMMAGIPPTLGSHRERWPCRDARRTWPRRGWTSASATMTAAFSGAAPGAAAAMTSMTGLTTATVAAVRSASSWATLARSASCSARPDSWRYTVTSSRRTMFSRPRSRAGPAGTARPAAGRLSVTSAAYDRNQEWSLWLSTNPGRRDRAGRPREPAGNLDNRQPGCAHFRKAAGPRPAGHPSASGRRAREGGLDCSSTGISTRVAACCHRRHRTRSR